MCSTAGRSSARFSASYRLNFVQEVPALALALPAWNRGKHMDPTRTHLGCHPQFLSAPVALRDGHGQLWRLPSQRTVTQSRPRPQRRGTSMSRRIPPLAPSCFTWPLGTEGWRGNKQAEPAGGASAQCPHRCRRTKFPPWVVSPSLLGLTPGRESGTECGVRMHARGDEGTAPRMGRIRRPFRRCSGPACWARRRSRPASRDSQPVATPCGGLLRAKPKEDDGWQMPLTVPRPDAGALGASRTDQCAGRRNDTMTRNPTAKPSSTGGAHQQDSHQ